MLWCRSGHEAYCIIYVRLSRIDAVNIFTFIGMMQYKYIIYIAVHEINGSSFFLEALYNVCNVINTAPSWQEEKHNQHPQECRLSKAQLICVYELKKARHICCSLVLCGEQMCKGKRNQKFESIRRGTFNICALPDLYNNTLNQYHYYSRTIEHIEVTGSQQWDMLLSKSK